MALALVSFFISWQASAASKQLDAHVHGSAALNLAIDNNAVILEFESPAINIVGFEHAPENNQQTQAIKQAIAKLETIGDIFSLPDSAICSPQSAKADWVSEHDEHEDHAEHEEHDEHEEHAEHDEHEEHEDHAGQASHSEFKAEYQISCKQIDKLDYIDVRLFEHFPSIEDLDVQGITDNGQFGAELNAGQRRIELK